MASSSSGSNNVPQVSVKDLPIEIREELQDLELEFRTGDLTKQGFEKKRQKLLQSFYQRSSKSIEDHITTTAAAAAAAEAAEASSNEKQSFKLDDDTKSQVPPSQSSNIGHEDKVVSQLTKKLSNSSLMLSSPQYRRASGYGVETRVNAVVVAKALMPSTSSSAPIAAGNNPNNLGHLHKETKISLDYEEKENSMNDDTFFTDAYGDVSSIKRDSSRIDPFYEELSQKLHVRRGIQTAEKGSSNTMIIKSPVTAASHPNNQQFMDVEKFENLLQQRISRGTELTEKDLLEDNVNANPVSLLSFSTIAALLRYRCHKTPKSFAISLVDSKSGRDLDSSITFEKLNGRAEKIAHLIKEKKSFRTGDVALLIYNCHEVIDLAAALFGCFYAGLVASVFIVPVGMDDIQHLIYSIHHLQVKLVLTTDANFKILCKDMPLTKRPEWPETLSVWRTQDFGVYQTKKKGLEELVNCNPSNVALIEVTKNVIGEVKGLVLSHKNIMHQLQSWRWISHATSNDMVLSSIDPRTGFGLLSSILCPVFSGSHAILYNTFPTNTLMANGSLNSQDSTISFLNYFTALSKFKCTIGVMEYGFLKCLMYDLRLLLSNQASQGAAIKKLFPTKSTSGNLLSFVRYLGITVQQKPDPDLIRALNEFVAKACKACFMDTVGLLLTSPEIASGAIIAGKRARYTDGKLTTGDRGYLETRLDGFSYRTHKFCSSETSNTANPSKASQDSHGLFYSFANQMAIGPLVPKLSAIVIDSDTETLPIPDNNEIGELWITGASLGRGFFGLSKQTSYSFEAKVSIGGNQSSGPEISPKWTFVRSRIMGWIDTEKQVVYLCGNLYEQVRFLGPSPEPKIPQTLVTQHYYYASEVNDFTVATTGHELTSSCLFSVTIRGLELSILVAEWAGTGNNLTRDQQTKLKNTAYSLYQKLYETFGLSLFLLLVVPYGRLVKRRDNRSVDADLVRKAFDLGLIYPLYVVSDFSRCFHSGIDIFSRHERKLKQLVQKYGPTVSTTKDQNRQIITGDPLFARNNSRNSVENVDHISQLIILRRKITPVDLNGDDTPIFALIDNRGKEIKRLTLTTLSQKIISCVSYFESEKVLQGGLRTGDCVLVMLPHGLDVVTAMHSCFYMGVVPVFIIPPEQNGLGRLNDDLHILFRLIQSLTIKAIIVNQRVEDLLKSKLVTTQLKRFRSASGSALPLPPLINIKTASNKKSAGLSSSSGNNSTFELVENYRPCAPMEPLSTSYKGNNVSMKPQKATVRRNSISSNSSLPAAEKLALIQVVINRNDGRFRIVQVSHGNILSQCRSFNSLFLGRRKGPLVSSMDPTSGPGLLLQLVQGLYSGRLTLLYPGPDYFSNPGGFFELIDRYQCGTVHLSVEMLKYALGNLVLDSSSFSLRHVDLFLVHAGLGDDRLSEHLFPETMSLFLANQLRTTVIHTSLWHPLHPLITIGAWFDRTSISLDLDYTCMNLDWVWQCKVPFGTTKSAVTQPDGVSIHEYGQVGPGVSVLVSAYLASEASTVLSNIEPLPPGRIGQIWLGSDNDSMSQYHTNDPYFSKRQTYQDPESGIIYYKTEYVGFLYSHVVGEPGDAIDDLDTSKAQNLATSVFVTGSEESIISPRPHIHVYAGDLEDCIENSHEAIAKGCSLVFKEDNGSRLVAMVDLVNPEELYNVLPCILHSVLEQHAIALDIVIFFRWNNGTGAFNMKSPTTINNVAANSVMMTANVVVGGSVTPALAVPSYFTSTTDPKHDIHVVSSTGGNFSNGASSANDSIFNGLLATCSAGSFVDRKGGKMRKLASKYLSAGVINNALHVFQTTNTFTK